MSIFDRIRRIARANIQSLMDQIEPPHEELTGKINELTSAIQEGKAAAAIYGATVRRMEKEAQTLTQSLSDLTARAEEALKAGSEQTARALLAEKIQTSERLARIEPALSDGKKTYDRLKNDLTRLQDQLRQTRMKLAELESRRRAAMARKAFADQADTAAGIGADDSAMTRAEDEVLEAEAHAEVAEDIRDGDIDLEQRSRELQVENELAALKDKLNQD